MTMQDAAINLYGADSVAPVNANAYVADFAPENNVIAKYFAEYARSRQYMTMQTRFASKTRVFFWAV